MALNFEQMLKSYADLIIHTGLNVRSGQKVLIRARIQAASLVRLATGSAYQAGARLVGVDAPGRVGNRFVAANKKPTR
jgi:aminopeptidase